MPTENMISLVCTCGKRLKAPASAAGKKAKCPACGSVVLVAPAVSAASPVPAAASGGRSAGDDEFGLGAMHELAAQAETAPVAGVKCPQCHNPMDENAAVCMSCGFDRRTGKSLNTTIAAAPVGYASPQTPRGGAVVDKMAPDGSLMLGIIFSAAFALVASIIWIVVAYATGFTVGYIAILIGIAAGIGMQLGHRGFSRPGGIIAAGMTLFAILIAKLIVIEIFLTQHGFHGSLLNLNHSKRAYYFFGPIGLIIMVVGIAAAFRTANGSMKN